MKILFDQGTPVPLRHALVAHFVATVHEMSWAELANGGLLGVAEAQQFDVLVTTDKNLRYQQNSHWSAARDLRAPLCKLAAAEITFAINCAGDQRSCTG